MVADKKAHNPSLRVLLSTRDFLRDRSAPLSLRPCMPPSLANRLLFHAAPPPPLLSSTNVAPELTPELYDFIALALRAYVSPWWSKISRYDKDLLPQITRIVAVVVQALDIRIQALDLPALVFQDVPVIVTQHYRDYRNAAIKTSTAYATGGAASLPTLFAHMQPHMAISSEGSLDAEYYRQIVDLVLKVCLPPEDYEPESERIIIREIVVKILLDDIIPKISQPWFIHKAMLDLIGSPDEPIYKVPTTHPLPLLRLPASLVTPRKPIAPLILFPQPDSHHTLCATIILRNVSRPHPSLQTSNNHHQACTIFPTSVTSTAFVIYTHTCC